MSLLPIIAGLTLGAGIAAAARWAGYDRDRSFYPTVLMVIASYYVLFAVMGGRALGVELAIATGFAGLAWLGGRGTALAGRGRPAAARPVRPAPPRRYRQPWRTGLVAGVLRSGGSCTRWVGAAPGWPRAQERAATPLNTDFFNAASLLQSGA